MDLDETDLEIIRLLYEDGRRPFAEIGDIVGLSGPAVSARVDRLREHGVIEGFTVELDRSQLVGGTPAILEFESIPDRADAVATALSEAEGTERVLTSAASEVIAVLRVPDGGIRDWVTTTVPEPIPAYRVKVLEGSERTATLDVTGFDVSCAECGNRVTAEGTTAEVGGEQRHFCCPSCESQYVQRYEEIAEGA
ncbi:MAG: AsnC family transcriptional regulator [Halobacteriaceae archaeon]